MKRIGLAMVCLCLLLTGCTSILERTYSTSEPHSSRLWESEAAGTLRAEAYQDIVNDLMILVGQHTETATLRLYNFMEKAALDTMEEAALEVRLDSALGSYAVDYITYTGQAQRGYYEVALQIGYRRTAEQLQAMVSTTGTEALYNLLEAAVSGERKELAVRVGYWTAEDWLRVADTVEQLRAELGLTENAPWAVNYYPTMMEAGLIEFLIEPTEDELKAASAVFGVEGTETDIEKNEKNLEQGIDIE